MYYVDADYDINETGIIIQWDEAWSNFLDNEGDMATPPWAGSLLRLIYDIDIQDNHSNDVSKIQFGNHFFVIFCKNGPAPFIRAGPSLQSHSRPAPFMAERA